MSYNTIVVALDGSKFSEHALPLALSIAHRSGAALRLVQVHTPAPPMYAYGYNYAAATVSLDVDNAVLESQQARLDDLATRLAQRSNLPCTAILMTGLGAEDGLCSAARQENADLMVITTHGRGPVSRFWLGSVANEMLRTAPCPVLAIRPGDAEVDLTVEPVFQQILVPVDGSAQSELILEATVALGALMQAEYHVLLVSAEASQLESAQQYLDSLAQRLANLARPIHTHAVVGTHVASRILEVAEELSADLIAMETHGWRGFQRWRMGSVADKVLRGASVPVLTHRTPAETTT